MLVRATSDIHGFTPEVSIEPCDLALIAGDFMPVHDHGSMVQRRFLLTQFSEWLDEQPADHIVLVSGNHDFLMQKAWAWRYVERLPEKVTYLRDSGADLCGQRIWGTPWSFCPEGWAFRYEHETHAERVCSNIPDDTDIIVSHGPPYGYGDRVLNGLMLGSGALMQRIRQVRPRLTVFGHIHEGYGRWQWPPVYMDPDSLEADLREVEALMSAPGFWESEEAAKVSAEHAQIQRSLVLADNPVTLANVALLNVAYEVANPVQAFEL